MARSLWHLTALHKVEPFHASKDRAVPDPWPRRVVAVLLAILVLRLISLWANSTELFFDEAQYWVWGKEPALGYFSKPPVLGWIIGLVTAICGDSEFCVRVASPILHTATAVVIFLLGGRLFDSRTGFWSAVVYATLPAVSLSATVISTDVPLLFFWSVALYAFVRFEESNDPRWAVALGVALGAGLMSKYAMAYFLPCALIYALAVRERPHVLLRPTFWLAIAIGGLILLPNLYWNLQNGFVTASHTGDNIGWDGRLHFARLAEFLGSQFAVVGPVLFAIYLVAIFRLVREGMNRQQVFLLAFSVPVLVLISFQAVLSKAYANWAALTYVGATILVTDLMVNRIPMWWHRLSLSINLFVFAVVATAVAFSKPGQLPLPDDLRPFDRMHGSIEIAEAVRGHYADDRYPVVLVDNRRMAALMTYYLRDLPATVMAWREDTVPQDHFQMTRAYQDDPKGPVLFLTNRRNPHEIIAAFGDAELLGEATPRAGEIGQIWFYGLRGYAGDGQSR